MTTWREALTSTWAEAQMRVQAQSRAMPNVFNVGILSNAEFGREWDKYYCCRLGDDHQCRSHADFTLCLVSATRLDSAQGFWFEAKWARGRKLAETNPSAINRSIPASAHCFGCVRVFLKREVLRDTRQSFDPPPRSPIV